MRKIRTFAVLVASAIALSACGETVNIGENGVAQGITVQATGTADVVPDAVRVSLAVSVLAETNDVALAQASASADAVRQTLLDMKIDEADFATQGLSVSPEYTYTEAEGQKVVGYRATQIFDVLVRDATNAGAVIDAVISKGGVNVSVNSTYPVVEDASAGAEAAREDAVTKARAKAEAYAELIGVELGDIVYLTEINAPTNVVAAKSSDAMAEGAATQIDLGTQEVMVTVEVRWKLD
ncbi:MAG: SIMPL domain-containing protein [Actinomycetota bacterium]